MQPLPTNYGSVPTLACPPDHELRSRVLAHVRLRGMTQHSLGTESGISTTTFSQWKGGKITSIYVSNKLWLWLLRSEAAVAAGSIDLPTRPRGGVPIRSLQQGISGADIESAHALGSRPDLPMNVIDAHQQMIRQRQLYLLQHQRSLQLQQERLHATACPSLPPSSHADSTADPSAPRSAAEGLSTMINYHPSSHFPFTWPASASSEGGRNYFPYSVMDPNQTPPAGLPFPAVSRAAMPHLPSDRQPGHATAHSAHGDRHILDERDYQMHVTAMQQHQLAMSYHIYEQQRQLMMKVPNTAWATELSTRPAVPAFVAAVAAPSHVVEIPSSHEQPDVHADVPAVSLAPAPKKKRKISTTTEERPVLAGPNTAPSDLSSQVTDPPAVASEPRITPPAAAKYRGRGIPPCLEHVLGPPLRSKQRPAAARVAGDRLDLPSSSPTATTKQEAPTRQAPIRPVGLRKAVSRDQHCNDDDASGTQVSKRLGVAPAGYAGPFLSLSAEAIEILTESAKSLKRRTQCDMLGTTSTSSVAPVAAAGDATGATREPMHSSTEVAIVQSVPSLTEERTGDMGGADKGIRRRALAKSHATSSRQGLSLTSPLSSAISALMESMPTPHRVLAQARADAGKPPVNYVLSALARELLGPSSHPAGVCVEQSASPCEGDVAVIIRGSSCDSVGESNTEASKMHSSRLASTASSSDNVPLATLMIEG